jgi:TonB family protein
MNTPILGVGTVMAAALLVGMASGQSINPPQAESNVACIERLEAPRYPPLATQARIQGTITVSVFLTTGGKVAKVETEAVSKYSQAKSLLGTPVWKVIREATFQPDCSGKTVTMVFHFDLEGTSPVDRKASVSFGYPNIFWIVAEAPLVQPEGQMRADETMKAIRVVGRIVDPVGDPVRNQPVLLRTVRSTDPYSNTRTDEDGVFTFVTVAAASYEVILEVPGFKRLTVPVTVTDSNPVNVGTVVLEMAPIGDGMEVTPYTAPVSQSLNASPDADSKGRQFRGRYANIDYGFSVEIPAQVVGEGTAASSHEGFPGRIPERGSPAASSIGTPKSVVHRDKWDNTRTIGARSVRS